MKTGGRCALLFEPGLGKTATALDYASLLALKSDTGEARVLVIAPLSAVDVWTQQAPVYVSPQVHFWAEALGGSILRRREILAARGEMNDNRALGYRASVDWTCSEPIHPKQGPDAVPTPRLIIEVINIDTLTSRSQVKFDRETRKWRVARPDETGSKTMADMVLRGIDRFDPDLVILDESHKAKTPSSNVSMLLYRIAKKVPRFILLTGTVMPHSPLDVFGQWRLIDDTTFGAYDGRTDERLPGSLGEFKDRYAVMGGYMGKEVISFTHLDDLQKRMAERSIVATKEDSLDLPPTTDTIVPVSLTQTERTAYDQMRQQLFTQLEGSIDVTAQNRLVMLMRLRQITSGYLPADEDNKARQIGTSKTDVIADLINTTLAGEQRVVVFCAFRAEISNIAKKIRDKKTTVEMITGDTHARDRLAIRRRFGSSEPGRIVLIAQIQTISLAVNELVSASHAIFGSLSWRRDDLVQARDRLHRIGQKRPVTFHWVLAENSVDEIIHEHYLDRTALEHHMLSHIKEGS